MAPAARPNPDDDFAGPAADFVYRRSLHRWQTALRRAKDLAPGQLPSTTLDLRQLLGRVLALPDRIPGDVQDIEGYSTWVNRDPSCPLKHRRERRHSASLRKKHAFRCLRSPDNFRVWHGTADNGIALLVLGWAYVLNARLAEAQGLPLCHLPHGGHGGELAAAEAPVLDIDVGYATDCERAWWRALTRRGMIFSVAREPSYLPWTLVVEDIGSVTVAGQGEAQAPFNPPSADLAAVFYLARFSAAYGLGSQCSAALAAALVIPSNYIPIAEHNWIRQPQLSLPAARR